MALNSDLQTRINEVVERIVRGEIDFHKADELLEGNAA